MEEVKDPEAEKCAHLWKIEEATGPISVGVCDKCHKTKEFRNYLEECSKFDDLSHLQKPPGEKIFFI